MATLSVSGDNSSYTITLSGMSTSTRYHVFIADLSTTGSITGYICLRSSLGTSSTWSVDRTSSSPYSNYSRSVYVYTSTSATSHSVGNTYTYDQMRNGCTFMDSDTIPAAGGGTTTYVSMSIYVPSSLDSVTVHANNDYYPQTFEPTGTYQSVSNLPSSGSLWIGTSDITPATGYGPPYTYKVTNSSGTEYHKF